MASDGGPAWIADPSLADVGEAIREREPLFHRAEWGTTRGTFSDMITEDYWEVGASGRRYGREHVLDVLEQRHRQPFENDWSISDFSCRRLGPDVFLATYTLAQGERTTRRATLWQLAAGRWRAIYHQGTVAEPAAGA